MPATRAINFAVRSASNLHKGRRLSKEIAEAAARDRVTGVAIESGTSPSSREADLLAKLSVEHCIVADQIASHQTFEEIQNEFLDLCDRPAETATHKSFFKAATVSAENHEIALKLLLANHTKELTRLVYFHFGYVPVLESIQVIRSVHVGEQIAKSQLYHIDYNAADVLKIFIYLSDVNTEDDGPLSVLRLPDIVRALLPHFPIHKSRNVESLLSLLGQRLSFIGPSGTTFLVQTSHIFHAGSRVAQDHERKVAIVTFRSPTRLRGSDTVGEAYPQPEVFNFFKSAVTGVR